MKPRTKRWLIIGIPIAVVAITLAIVLPLTLSGSRDTLHGRIIAPAQTTSPDGGCETGGGYNDISPGVAVTVAGPNGTTLAVGRIDPNPRTTDFGDCEFQFHVRGVPTGYGQYGVTVSNRGTLVFDEEDVFSDNVLLQLG